jgi:hypothetical protein
MASNYKREWKAAFAVAAAATVTKTWALPPNRGKGAVVLYIKTTALAGSTTLTVTFLPVLCTPEYPVDDFYTPLTAAQFTACTGATAKTARVYKAAAGFTACTAYAVAEGGIYMLEMDMDGLAWDGVQIAITGAVANCTVQPLLAND